MKIAGLRAERAKVAIKEPAYLQGRLSAFYDLIHAQQLIDSPGFQAPEPYQLAPGAVVETYSLATYTPLPTSTGGAYAIHTTGETWTSPKVARRKRLLGRRDSSARHRSIRGMWDLLRAIWMGAIFLSRTA